MTLLKNIVDLSGRNASCALSDEDQMRVLRGRPVLHDILLEFQSYILVLKDLMHSNAGEPCRNEELLKEGLFFGLVFFFWGGGRLFCFLVRFLCFS